MCFYRLPFLKKALLQEAHLYRESGFSSFFSGSSLFPDLFSSISLKTGSDSSVSFRASAISTSWQLPRLTPSLARMLMWWLSMSTSSHSEPRSFNTSESLEGDTSGRRRAVEEGEEESRDLGGGKYK